MSSLRLNGVLLFTVTTLLTLTLRRSSSSSINGISRNIKRSKTVMQKYLLTDNLDKQQEQALIRDLWCENDGEHQWLEEIDSKEVMSWVVKQNEQCISKLVDPNTTQLYNSILSILDSKDKIPFVDKIGDFYYNFWQDADNIRGILRRTTLISYRSNNTVWETVLDIDKLGKDDNVSWVYKGYTCYYPDDVNTAPTRMLLSLSIGGQDAAEMREFDLETMSFVKDGFFLPSAKSRVSWKDIDTLFVGTDFGADSMTNSGYPRLVKEWKRGTTLDKATLLYEGDKTDVSCAAYVCKHRGFKYEIIYKAETFYSTKWFVKLTGSNEFVKLEVPHDSAIKQFHKCLLITLRSSWTIKGVVYKQGSLLSVELEQFLKLKEDAKITVLFTPSDRVSLESSTNTLNHLILSVLENVKSKLLFWKYNPNPDVVEDSLFNDEQWTLSSEEPTASIRGTSVSAIDDEQNDFYWLTRYSFTEPSKLALANASLGYKGISEAKVLKSLPEFFNSSDLKEEQREAISEDGTKIPYFIISKKNIEYDGTNPTHLYGYGGFKISMLPSYAAVTGKAWLEKGGVYVVANIRGGNEFGPMWHTSALKENRKKCYDDFIAVAEHLISTKVTATCHLSCEGGSNGGLLMGNMITRRPDLFKSVVCQVPLLDMRRYNKLLAGASWVAEYGDPDTDDWKNFLSQYSSYHNIHPTDGPTVYPHLLMMTSMKDDRVHPYHARSFVLRLLELRSVYYFYHYHL